MTKKLQKAWMTRILRALNPFSSNNAGIKAPIDALQEARNPTALVLAVTAAVYAVNLPVVIVLLAYTG